MRKSLNFKFGPPTLAAALGLGLLTPLALVQISCSTAAKDKASNQNPEITSLQFSDTTPWPAPGSGLYGSSWTITAGSTTYLQATYGEVGGTATITPSPTTGSGSLTVVSATPIPFSPTVTTPYQLVLKDGAGHQISQTATITVIPAPTSPITTSSTILLANTGNLQASVPGTPVNAAGSTYLWTATNATINSGATTNAITFTAGSANADGSAKPMTLTCTVTAPSSTPKVSTTTAPLSVLAAPPTALNYSAASLVLYQGLPALADVPTEQGVVQTYSVDPSLPAGLVLDPVQGTISGTPTTVTASQTYTVTAQNSGGSSTFPILIEVDPQPTLVFNAPSPAKIGPGGSTSLTWSTGPSVASVAITAVPADPTLPSVFTLGNGLTTVHPTQTTVYTITATLQGGGTEPPLTQTVTVDTTPLAFGTNLSANPVGIIAFGSGTTLNWALTGTPNNSLTLTSPASLVQTLPLNDTSFSINPVLRRQAYTLTAANGASTVSSTTVTVAAKGLDTLAGNIVLGGGNHDGTGSAAQFNMPYNLATDPQGNIYVPDSNNHIIRVITPAGVVSTLAGVSGVPGKTDGVTGLAAQFNAPRGVAYWVDPSTSQAYLFVAEYTNDTIRKITLNTSVTPPQATYVAVFAGTIGSYGTSGDYFDDPTAIVIDSNNNMYVSEAYDGDVLKITGLSGAQGNTYAMNGGAITQYAGQRSTSGYLDGANLSAKFNGIEGMAIDSNNNIYVSEYYSNHIRKITSTTTSTIAGDNNPADATGQIGFIDGPLGTSRVYSPGGLAISGTTLYIADTKNNAVRTLSLTDPTFKLTTVIGTPATNTAGTGTIVPGTSGNANGNGTSATLAWPQGLTFDPSGILYISETANDDIRKADTNLNVTTLAGSAPQVGNADGVPGVGELAINPGISGNVTMASMVMDSAQNIYVADTYNNAIRMITPAGVLSTIAGTAGLGTAGHADGLGSAASFYQPSGLAMDNAGNIYVADQGNSTIRELTKGSQGWTVTTIAGIPLTTGIVEGAGATIGAGGAVTGAGVATFKYPYGIVINPKDGNLYVADAGNAAIRELVFNAGTWTVSKVTTSVLSLATPTGLAADASGNLYISDRKNNYVGQLAFPVAPSTTWVGSIIAGCSGNYGFANGLPTASKTTSSLVDFPQGLTVDGSGNVWVADYGNNVVREIVPTTTGGVTTWNISTPIGVGVLTTNQPVKPVSIGTATGGFGNATVLMPQAVLVSPFAPHDLFVTTNGGVAQATSIDNQ